MGDVVVSTGRIEKDGETENFDFFWATMNILCFFFILWKQADVLLSLRIPFEFVSCSFDSFVFRFAFSASHEMDSSPLPPKGLIQQFSTRGTREALGCS
jgi:hypothetical protein